MTDNTITRTDGTGAVIEDEDIPSYESLKADFDSAIAELKDSIKAKDEQIEKLIADNKGLHRALLSSAKTADAPVEDRKDPTPEEVYNKRIEDLSKLSKDRIKYYM